MLSPGQMYQNGIQVGYDAEIEAVSIFFRACPMETSPQVTLAFQILYNKVSRTLGMRGQARGALIVDVAGLVIGKNVTPIWGQALKTFLQATCIEVNKGQYLIARYNSKTRSQTREEISETLKRIQIMTSAVLNDFQSNIFTSREEAAAFLLRMRELTSQ